MSKPTECQACGALLLGEDTQPHRHQVVELPRVKPEITEYQLHTLTCLACGCQNKAEWPSNMVVSIVMCKRHQTDILPGSASGKPA
jgi:hypothetical protein